MPYNRVEQALINAGWTEVEPGKFKSKQISHSQSTEVTVDNIRYISFNYRVSSEANCDVFYFYKNNSQEFARSGSVNGSCEYHNDDNSAFNIKFAYRKDGSVNTGDDCVYIYNINIQVSVSLSDGTKIYYIDRYNNDNYDYIVDIDNNLWVKGNFLGNTYNDYTQIEVINNINEITFVDNNELQFKNINNDQCVYDGNIVIIYTKKYHNWNYDYIVDIDNNLWVKGNFLGNTYNDYTQIEVINNIKEIVSISDDELVNELIFKNINNEQYGCVHNDNIIIYIKRYNNDNYDYIVDINNNLWVKGSFLGNTYNDYTQIEVINNIKEMISITDDKFIFKNINNDQCVYDGVYCYISKYINNNSYFIIDNNNNLWVKGDNEFGKLGCNSENNLIEDYVKIENEELINNVSEIDTYNENENAKTFFILKTKDEKIYFAGKFDNTEYRSWIAISSLFYYNKKKDNSKIYSKSFIISDYSNISLFTFKKKNNFFAFKINLITDDEAIQFILSGNNDNIYIYTDYAVVPTIPFKFVLSNPDVNGNIVLYLSFDILNDREDYFNLIRKSVFVKVENIHSNNFDINNIPGFDTENILYSKVFEKSDKGYFGSSDDIHGVEIPYDFNDKFFAIDVNLDIGNTKSIINDINIRSDEYEDKEIIPYEDDNYKGPQFLYPVFYNLGIPFNKFIKFEGNITVNGIMYPVEYVKISTPIDENNKYGVIQFILSEDTKLLTDVSKSYLKEYEGIKINSDEIKENVFGITFYPIIINNDNEYEYRVLNDIPNTLITQNAAANWLIHDYKISDVLLNKIVVKDDKCLFATDKDIYLFDLITLNPIITKHFTNNILSIGSQNNNEDSYDFVIKLSQNNYLLNKDTLDIISEINIDEIHLLDKTTDYFENINLAYALQNVRRTYINRYDIKGDNEQFIYEYKFENNENYFGFIKDNVSGKYRLSVYRDNMINNGIYAKTENVEIVPSVVESLDGILYCPENIVREGFPKSFDM